MWAFAVVLPTTNESLWNESDAAAAVSRATIGSTSAARSRTVGGTA